MTNKELATEEKEANTYSCNRVYMAKINQPNKKKEIPATGENQSPDQEIDRYAVYTYTRAHSTFFDTDCDQWHRI